MKRFGWKGWVILLVGVPLAIWAADLYLCNVAAEQFHHPWFCSR